MTRFPWLGPERRDRMLAAARMLFRVSIERSRVSNHPLATAACALVAAHWLASGEEPPGACSTAFVEREIERSIDLLGDTELVPSLLDGYLGVAVMAELANTVGLRSSGLPIDSAIDEPLREHLFELCASGMYDFSYGVAGAIWYEMIVNGSLRPSVVAERVGMLGEMARPSGAGVAWWTPPERASHRFPKTEVGYFDLGFAHGQAGVIAVLSRVAAYFPELREARSLFTQALAAYDAMLAVRKTHFVPHATICAQGGDRHGWCYGTPGVAVAMFSAARLLEDDSRALLWTDKLNRALADAPTVAQVDGPGFCHGAAGIAYLALEAEADLGATGRAAISRWFDLALDLVSRTDFRPDVHPLFNGEAGIALVLLSATTGCGTHWADLFGLPAR